jgi:hypothetical protein
MPEEISIRDEIERALERTPFQPFIIRLTSGDQYEVTRRLQAAVGGNVMVLLHRDLPSIYIRLNQIVAVEIPAPA